MAGKGSPSGATAYNYRHGGWSTPEYQSWIEMRRRCRATNRHNSHLYSGRGIAVCQRWDSFTLFLFDVGARPSSRHTLDRIDGNGNYEPGNVRWATKAVQGQNSRAVWLLTLDGERISVREVARRLAMRPWKLYQRFSEAR